MQVPPRVKSVGLLGEHALSGLLAGLEAQTRTLRTQDAEGEPARCSFRRGDVPQRASGSVSDLINAALVLRWSSLVLHWQLIESSLALR